MNRSELQALSRGHHIGYAEGVSAGLLMAARLVRQGGEGTGAVKLLGSVAGSLERLAGTLAPGEAPPLSGSGGGSHVSFIRSLPSEPSSPEPVLPDNQTLCGNCGYVRFKNSICTKCGSIPGKRIPSEPSPLSVHCTDARCETTCLYCADLEKGLGTPSEPLGNPDSQADGAS